MGLNQGLSLSESKRKLASIQKITDIQPIENADKIEVVTVLGWKVVVKKSDQFKIGDKGVFFEVDSFLPVVPEYEFIGDVLTNPITIGSTDDQGYRLHTLKLRNQISQGLFLNFKDVHLYDETSIPFLESLPIGTDVTELLKVTKWQRKETNSDDFIVADFPTQYTPKSDELRIQSNPKEFSDLKGLPYYVSSKIDGTSMTIIKHNDDIMLCTRNGVLDESQTDFRTFFNASGLKDLLEAHKGNLIMQGEFYGEGIMQNKLKIKGKRWAVFTISEDNHRVNFTRFLDIVNELHLEIPTIVQIGASDSVLIDSIKSKIKLMNKNRKFVNPLKTARNLNHPEPNPIILLDNVAHNFNLSAEQCIEFATGQKYQTSKSQMEGLVFRPLIESDTFNPISFKALNNKFLLKYDE